MNSQSMDAFITQEKTYAECLVIIQGSLNAMNKPHGTLKKWCEGHVLNYQKVIKIKTGSESSYRPQFVVNILKALGHNVRLVRNFGETGQGTDNFVFEKGDHSERRQGKIASKIEINIGLQITIL